MQRVTPFKKEVASMEMRNCFIDTLQEMMDHDDRIIALEADLGGASNTIKLKNTHADRFIQCGIAEANMIGVAAGLNIEGFIPYIHTFGPFATRRVLDQIYMSGAYSHNTFNIYGSDPGFCVGVNGGTHTTWEDIAIMRTIPEAIVCDACDHVQFRWLLKEFSSIKGIHYVRANRKALRQIYDESAVFEIGKGNVLKKGSDILLISAGELCADALDVANFFDKQDISCEVIDMFCIKPLDIELILQEVKGKRLLVTYENHSIIGGLGSAVAEVVADYNLDIHFLRHGVMDQFGQVGTPEFLKEEYHLNKEAVIDKIQRIIRS